MPADPPLPLGLPWYFTAVMVALWVSTVAGAVALGVRRLRRRTRSRRRRRVTERLPDVRSR